MKVIVWYDVSDNHKVMTTLILVVLISVFAGIHRTVTLSGFANFSLQSHNPHSKAVAEVVTGHTTSTEAPCAISLSSFTYASYNYCSGHPIAGDTDNLAL
jgi:hypothetical protein